MSVVQWTGAFVLGVLAQALADEGARLFGEAALWFLAAPLRLLASGFGLWIWLLIGYPIWSALRGRPAAETPFQLLGLALATVGLLLALGLVLDYLASLRPIGVLRSLFSPLELLPLDLGVAKVLSRPASAVATLLVAGAAVGVGGYLGRRG